MDPVPPRGSPVQAHLFPFVNQRDATMWLTDLLGIEVILNDRRRTPGFPEAGTRIFVRNWWTRTGAARRRLCQRNPGLAG